MSVITFGRFLIILSLLIAISSISVLSRAACATKAKSCVGRLMSRRHRVVTSPGQLNVTDRKLWAESGFGRKEVGIIELVDPAERILATSNVIQQAQSGIIVQTDVHVPIKSAYLDLLQVARRHPSASCLRFSHVHPKFHPAPGIVLIGLNWIFSPGDVQAGYEMKFGLEQLGLSNLNLEMHLIYQPPLARGPRKKWYQISHETTWAAGGYSLGRKLDRDVNRSGLAIRSSKMENQE